MVKNKARPHYMLLTRKLTGGWKPQKTHKWEPIWDRSSYPHQTLQPLKDITNETKNVIRKGLIQHKYTETANTHTVHVTPLMFIIQYLYDYVNI